MIQAVRSWILALPYGHLISNRFFAAGVIIAVSIILAKLTLVLFNRVLQKIAKRTVTKVDDLIFEHTRKPLFYLIIVLGLRFALMHVGVGGSYARFVNSLLAIVFLYILLNVFDIVIEAWAVSFSKRTHVNLDEVALPLFHRMAKVVLFIVAFLWILDIWEIDITPYLAGVGIGGIILGLALQDSLKNVFSGVSLLLDKTFQVGDKVKIESGTVGIIHDIGLRSTKLRTFDNEIIFIPNGYLANTRVRNYTRPDQRARTGVDFSVVYGANVGKVRKIVLSELAIMKFVLKDPEPLLIFNEMGESGLKCSAKFWVDQWGDAYSARLEATQRIYDALRKAKIEIPFPTRTLYMKKGR